MLSAARLDQIGQRYAHDLATGSDPVDALRNAWSSLGYTDDEIARLMQSR